MFTHAELVTVLGCIHFLCVCFFWVFLVGVGGGGWGVGDGCPDVVCMSVELVS